jgi:HAD superfamily hydrolase (TIGR01490 family)
MADPADPAKAPGAFFDLDRTVMSGASTYFFAKAAVKSGFYSRRMLLRGAWKTFWFKRRGASDEQSEAARDQVLAAVQGRTRAGLEALLPEVLGPILLNVYPEIYRRILDHERAGVPTYLCSASPIEVVEPVARALGMTGALATRAETDADGTYTGRLVGPFCYGSGKVVAMESESERAGIDLDASWGYSDSISDQPMLERVGRAVAVNPDKALRSIALEREWEILRVEPRHGLRAAIGAGIVTGGAGVGVGTAYLLRRMSRRS